MTVTDDLADVNHLLPEELPGADAVLAPLGAQHRVHQGVRRRQGHRAQHLRQ